ncbi:MAG: hypothetical protein AB8F78_19830 [Saprospiraceae bacterium]
MKLTSLPARTLFLIDGFGAMLSAFMLGFVLMNNQPLIGMPVEVLQILASIPCIFAMYSFAGRFIIKGRVEPYLKWIAIANLMYCLTTAGLVLLFFPELTGLGIAYFVVEIAIVVYLSRAELIVALKR